MNDPKQIHKALSPRLSEGLISRFQIRYFETFAEHLSPEIAEAELLGLAELIKITAYFLPVNENAIKNEKANEKAE